MQPQAYALSDKGGRQINEDYFGWRIAEGRGIFVVADGLGGFSSGKLASRLVTDDILKSWESLDVNVDEAWLEDCLENANHDLIDQQYRHGNKAQTTVVVLVIEAERAFWAHVGDTRLYHLHGGKIESVTRDHSVAYSKYRSGEISRAEIASDPDQSRLLRTLGNTNESLRIEYGFCDGILDNKDSFFMCTDGAWEYLSDTEILIDRLKSSTPIDWSRHILCRMLDRVSKGNDNFTVLAVTMEY